MAKTTTDFLAAVKRRISMPASRALLEDEDILGLGDEAMRAHVVPTLVSVRQDYFVYVQDIPLVSGQASYDISYRAMARSLRDLKLVDSQSSISDMQKISLEDAHLYGNDNNSGNPYGFHFQGDKIVVLPTPSSSNSFSIRQFFELPPGNLVALSAVAQITAISGGDITTSGVPSTFSTNTPLDFIAGRQGNSTRSYDKLPTNIAGSTITFATADVPSTLTVGDYIALAEQSPVLQIPDDCFPWLVTLTGRRVLYAISDFEGYDRLEKSERKEETNLLKVLEPRVRGETTKIVNRSSLVRQGRFYYGRGIIF